MSHGKGQSGVHDFDFLVGSWSVLNKRKKGQIFQVEQEVIWEEFSGCDRFEKSLDGRAIIEHWEAVLPSGEKGFGLSIKALDPVTQHWSIIWIDNRNPLDFRPLHGTFEEGVGTFFQVIDAPDGQPLHVRFIWERITENAARWQQAFSLDGGEHWETNWVMEFTREQV